MAFLHLCTLGAKWKWIQLVLPESDFWLPELSPLLYHFSSAEEVENMEHLFKKKEFLDAMGHN